MNRPTLSQERAPDFCKNRHYHATDSLSVWPRRTSQPLHNEVGNERSTAAHRPSAGVEDLIIVPSVVIALAISKLLKAMFSILIYILDYAFPILLQLMRIPLLTARLIGDGMELLFEGVARCLPVSSAKRDALRARVRQQWIWFRRNISYQAFEHALHHAFEAGM